MKLIAVAINLFKSPKSLKAAELQEYLTTEMEFDLIQAVAPDAPGAFGIRHGAYDEDSEMCSIITRIVLAEESERDSESSDHD